ncbi:hypothetical protein [Staphylococcus epidermidis]|uniref:hypothetical protein n=1 Tax=Staphylococcus epidermidis TaxID=1282 RepID=UPI000D1CB4F8|nr:hypothetical protein [Staphylococcus epidermidis]MCG2350909.1 hypothetical protein [Staphylococcus epidermidis]MEB7398497.1 hypothetical protein [Staphylococcus epidermidis]PTE58680.1 hypothetical protein BUY53_01385 [Staphylococcus epidermidis]PTE70605.1 hypothetical protein BUY50_09110 [Staphylococcus epidermidis]
MGFKHVYLFDGSPYLAFRGDDGEYDYPNDEWTETPPPEGLYEPIWFDGNEWHGATREEWLKTLPKEETEEEKPDPSIIQMAQTQMQVAESSYQLRETQKKLAETMMDNAEKDKRLESLEQQQAQVLLELAEIKGGE